MLKVIMCECVCECAFVREIESKGEMMMCNRSQEAVINSH